MNVLSIRLFLAIAMLQEMNGSISNVVLHDLDLNFQGQTFQVAILTSTFSKNANITIAIRLEVRNLPSNGATANVVNHDLDLFFQGHEF